jgi:hypothetical protein
MASNARRGGSLAHLGKREDQGLPRIATVGTLASRAVRQLRQEASLVGIERRSRIGKPVPSDRDLG